MNVNFEYSKTLACEGSILMWLCFVPYVGPILAIIGLILLMRSLKEFSGYYQDEKIYSKALTGIKYYVVAIIAAAVAIGSIVTGVWTATHFTDVFVFTAGFGVGLIAFFVGIVVAFVFFVLAASHLRNTFNSLADHSGESSFRTAGTLLWWGSMLTIVLVGLVLIPIAWILATVGFFTMKPRPYQQYNAQPNNYTAPPTQPTEAKPNNQNGTQV
jgi:uncharacterized membrane protein